MNYIEICKTQIATSLTNEGVEISDGKTAYVNGNLVTGNYTSDFSSKDDIDTYGYSCSMALLKISDNNIT